MLTPTSRTAARPTPRLGPDPRTRCPWCIVSARQIRIGPVGRLRRARGRAAVQEQAQGLGAARARRGERGGANLRVADLRGRRVRRGEVDAVHQLSRLFPVVGFGGCHEARVLREERVDVVALVLLVRGGMRDAEVPAAGGAAASRRRRGGGGARARRASRTEESSSPSTPRADSGWRRAGRRESTRDVGIAVAPPPSRRERTAMPRRTARARSSRGTSQRRVVLLPVGRPGVDRQTTTLDASSIGRRRIVVDASWRSRSFRETREPAG